MAFHFPLMPRLFMALHTEDRLPVLDIMAQTPAIPDTCRWALFLRSHEAPVPVIEVDGSWRDLIDGSDRPALEAVLPVFLGRRTAELHAALARVDGSPAIAPEPFTEQAQRSRWTSGRWRRRYRIANSRCSRDSAGCWHGH